MRKLLILLCLFLFVSCIRTYKVTFNYNVNGKEISSEETANTEDLEDRIINLPKGSGNFIIYIQADVPKTVDASIEAEASLPLLP